MFARTMWDAEDIAHQGEILNAVSGLLDEGTLSASVWRTMPWSLENIREARTLHAGVWQGHREDCYHPRILNEPAAELGFIKLNSGLFEPAPACTAPAAKVVITSGS